MKRSLELQLRRDLRIGRPDRCIGKLLHLTTGVGRYAINRGNVFDRGRDGRAYMMECSLPALVRALFAGAECPLDLVRLMWRIYERSTSGRVRRVQRLAVSTAVRRAIATLRREGR